jgi:hypothetical protein
MTGWRGSNGQQRNERLPRLTPRGFFSVGTGVDREIGIESGHPANSAWTNLRILSLLAEVFLWQFPEVCRQQPRVTREN